MSRIDIPPPLHPLREFYLAEISELQRQRPDLDKAVAAKLYGGARAGLGRTASFDDILAWVNRVSPPPTSDNRAATARTQKDPPSTAGRDAKSAPGELSRDAILEARAAWLAEGQKSTSIYRRLGTTDATLNRARRYWGLIPWPED